MKIAILGGGNMGSAFAKGIYQNIDKCTVGVSDTNKDKLKQISAGNSIVVSSKNMDIVDGADIVILAIKPQDFGTLLTELKNKIPKKAIVISIAAGVKISKIKNGLKHSLVVRVMPNLPALIGKGMSSWFGPGLNYAQKNSVKLILKSIGEEVEVKSEDEIDKATAISGSGPAYVFYFAEKMIKAGVKLGLKEDVSRKLTIQMLLGATELLSKSEDNEKTLRERVTSKKGTTEQAIKTFDKKKMGATIEAAVKNAYKRAKELSK